MLQPQNWAKRGWFFSQRNELYSVDFLAKSQLVSWAEILWKSVRFLGMKSTENYINFWGIINWKRELIFIGYLLQKKIWILIDICSENGLIFNRFLSKKPSWFSMDFCPQNDLIFNRFLPHKLNWFSLKTHKKLAAYRPK